uniref:Uncharacterized protein n=1 Tax=Thermosporothrix sp. COM3 TaxID=2490863 RepID=A0A455SF08_9CHLR|nr:hypothetical protein KTC_17980 [Thermosporothrix sp. COM3]
MVLNPCKNGTIDTQKKVIAINTRYPHEVYEAMKQLAAAHGRSFHGGVVRALREYIKQYQQGRGKDVNQGVYVSLVPDPAATCARNPHP